MIYNRFNREISCHHITVSLHHRITASLCQSVICLAPCHQTSQSFALAPCHQTSQSFALPPATKSVSHLPCPLPLHHRITASLHHCATASPCHCISQSFALPPATKPVSHLPCPLPPNQLVICLPPYHRVTACHHVTASPHHHVTASPHQCITTSPCTTARHCVTALVSHLPCPLPPNQSVICLAPYHHITASLCQHITASPYHHVTTSPHHCITTSLHHQCHRITASPHHCLRLPPATKPVSHLPCPLPPNQSVICLAPYHHITVSPHHCVSQSFALPPATKPVSHLPCPLPSHHRVTPSLC